MSWLNSFLEALFDSTDGGAASVSSSQTYNGGAFESDPFRNDSFSESFACSDPSESFGASSCGFGADWTDDYGTAVQFQVPAETWDSFQSDDWSLSGSGGFTEL